jgi:release factor glutamine methyltransferase
MDAMRLFTLPGVFRPRSDSVLLARLAAVRARPGMSVLDPFTGSGILAIAAAEAGARATAVDVSRRAVLCAWLNARLNGTRIRAVRGDLFAPVADERFDLIVANPPYLPGTQAGEVRGAARAWEGGSDGRLLIDRLCDGVRAHLTPGGELLMIHSSVCGEQATFERLAGAGLEAEVIDRRRGPVGPLLAPRVAEREEELLVFSARMPGREAAWQTPESRRTETVPTSSAASST